MYCIVAVIWWVDETSHTHIHTGPTSQPNPLITSLSTPLWCAIKLSSLQCAHCILCIVAVKWWVGGVKPTMHTLRYWTPNEIVSKKHVTMMKLIWDSHYTWVGGCISIHWISMQTNGNSQNTGNMTWCAVYSFYTLWFSASPATTLCIQFHTSGWQVVGGTQIEREGGGGDDHRNAGTSLALVLLHLPDQPKCTA